jgi:hypothetical protein
MPALEVAAQWAAKAKMETQTELLIGKQLGSYELQKLQTFGARNGLPDPRELLVDGIFELALGKA